MKNKFHFKNRDILNYLRCLKLLLYWICFFTTPSRSSVYFYTFLFYISAEKQAEEKNTICGQKRAGKKKAKKPLLISSRLPQGYPEEALLHPEVEHLRHGSRRPNVAPGPLTPHLSLARRHVPAPGGRRRRRLFRRLLLLAGGH